MSKILIVDDNAAEVRHPIKRQLGRIHGPENILEAEDGRAAVEMVERHRPDVVILDIMMPVMDGISACQAIRSDGDNLGIYIIMLTGRDGGMPEGLAVGADVYLRKPCAFDELLAVVNRGLEEVALYKASLDKHRTLENQVGHLNESRWAFQDIITSLSVGLILCAPNPWGRIRYMNPAAMQRVGRPASELRDAPVGQLFVETDIGQLLEDILSNAKPRNIPKTLRIHQGKPLPVLLSGGVICDTRGQDKWILLELHTLWK
ncbi:MAG: response regulator [Magnetococcales bacterium]|nr:response regulator [Magnetococcales bacterium]